MARGRGSSTGKRRGGARGGASSRGRGRHGKPAKKSKKLNRMDKQHAQEFGELHPVNDDSGVNSYRDHASKRISKDERQVRRAMRVASLFA